MSKAQFHNPQNPVSGHNRYHQNFTYDELNSNGHRIDLLESSGAARTYYVDNFKLIGSDTTRTGPVAWDAETADFGYDANGNLISQSGKFSGIQYDHRNLPVRFTMEDGDTLRAAYNGEGRRILKESSGGAWQFYLKDGPRTLAVIDRDRLSHMNLFGNALFGRILAMNCAIDTTNPRRYYLKDHLGSTRAVVDNNGNVLETFDYYPFGLLMPKRSSTSGNTIEKFAGKERDERDGFKLDYFGIRYYDAKV